MLGAILPCRDFGFRALLLFGSQGRLGFRGSGCVRRRVEDQSDRALRRQKKEASVELVAPVRPRAVT